MGTPEVGARACARLPFFAFERAALGSRLAPRGPLRAEALPRAAARAPSDPPLRPDPPRRATPRERER